ncbi:MAG: hypothetical protein IPI49_00150 [Myxococcales bacterium]|nr:hypothetical protein [Myxococcales bacterium]
MAAVEDFLGLPLPLPKLDLVAVPRFFGGMENPGLITLDAEHVLGGPGVEGPQQLGHRAALARLLVHELAHQWFGNLITPSSWQDLWISEGFATWVSTRKLRAMPELDSEVARGLSWVSARQADAAGDRAVRRWAHATPQRPGPTAAQLEELGDAIIYEKSASVLHMMSHWLGEERFTAAVRAFLLARAGDAVSGEELARALAVLRPEAPGVLLRQLDNRGVPRVRFSLRCAAGPAAGPGAAGPGAAVQSAAGQAAVVDIEIQAEQGAMPLPVCLRFPDARGKIASLCQLVVAKGQVALPTDTCPAWLSGNDDLSGYYDAQGSLPAGHPRHPRPWVPSWARTTAERLGLGAEHALRVPDAAQVPAALAFVIERVDAGAASAASVASAASAASAAPTASAAARRELLEHALGDLGLIERLEPLIAEPQLPAWRRLVSRHAEQLGGALFDPESGAALERWVAAQSAAILTEVPWPRLATERARAALALGVSSAAAGTLAQAWRVALRDASPSAAAATTAELLRAVARASGAEADELLAALAAIPPSGVPLLFAALDATPPPGVTSAPAAGQAAGATLTWSRAAPVVTALLRRRSTQAATLAALPSRMTALRQAVAPVELVPILRALGRLCSPEHRAAAVALFSAAGEVPGRAELEQSVLTSIQHCPAWQAQRAAHVGAALAPFSASAP